MPNTPTNDQSTTGKTYAPTAGSVFRHRKTGKTKLVRYVTDCGVHWTGSQGEWRYECLDRWNSWLKNAEGITPNAGRTFDAGRRSVQADVGTNPLLGLEVDRG